MKHACVFKRCPARPPQTLMRRRTFFFRKKEKTKGHMAFPSLLSRPRNRQLASRCALPVRRLSKGAFLAPPDPSFPLLISPHSGREDSWSLVQLHAPEEESWRPGIRPPLTENTTTGGRARGEAGSLEEQFGIRGSGSSCILCRRITRTQLLSFFFYVFFLSNTELQLMTLFLRVNKKLDKLFCERTLAFKHIEEK